MDFGSHFVDDLMKRGNVLTDLMVLKLKGAKVVKCRDGTMAVFLLHESALEVVEG